MLDKKFIWIGIVFVALLSMSAISASDNLTSSTDDDSLCSIDNSDDSLDASEDEVKASSSNTFTDLYNLIVANDDSNVILNQDYTFSEASDNNLVNGIPISKSIIIRGNGFTINGANKARIFNLTNYVEIYNVNLVNANADKGAAIIGDNYIVCNSNFTNNHATKLGGALYTNGYGKAINCIFRDNSANEGGAIYRTDAIDCEFIGNSAKSYCGAMSYGSATTCNFVRNSAIDHSGAFGFGTAYKCTFINNTAQQSGALGGSGHAEACTFIGNSANEGGAIFGCEAISCSFINNHANQGGAMAGGIQAVNCNFTSNYADTQGGALLAVYAYNCIFKDNHAYQGGALVGSDANSCNFISNYAVNGGAVYDAQCSYCNFTYNSAKLGGALYEAFVYYSLFMYNSAVNGGAVYFLGSSSEYAARSCNFINNSAEEYGGALYGTSAESCIFYYNTAKFGGAISSNSAASYSIFKGNVAKVSGGVKFDSSVNNCEFRGGNSPSYTLKVSDFSSIEGFGGNVVVKLYDSPNYPVVGENITIKVVNSRNVLVGTYKAQTGYNWFVDFPAGSYRATISVDNNDLYEVDSVRMSINIQKSSFIYVVGLTTDYNTAKSLIINLHDSKGTVIKYAPVSVNMNGVITKYTTNDNGQVIISTKSLVPNTYNVIVNYAGSSTYFKSSATATIVVNKLTPILTASKKTFKLKDKTKKYTLKLKTNKKVAMINSIVKIKVKNKVYSAKTNSKGIATFKLKKLTKKGKFNALITFDGNQYYKASSKTVKITVKK